MSHGDTPLTLSHIPDQLGCRNNFTCPRETLKNGLELPIAMLHPILQTGSENSKVINSRLSEHMCNGCGHSIKDRHILKALDSYWHENCLKCSCCNTRLIDVGSTLYSRANMLLCRRDYLRMFGATGQCAGCQKMILAIEYVMRARGKVYHLDCFHCHQCNHRLRIGERFYLCDNKLLCEYDYEERQVFANMSFNYDALVQIKEQTKRLCPVPMHSNPLMMTGGFGMSRPASL